MAVIGLLASTRAWGEATPVPAEVQFNDQFLQHAQGLHVDLSRYERGNPALPGHYQVDSYVNNVWQGRLGVRLAQVGADSANVQLCVDRDLLDRLGVDVARLSEAATSLLTATGRCTPIGEAIAQASASFDNNEQRLDVSVPQAAMRRHARDWTDPKLWDYGVTAATLQYNLNSYRTRGTHGSGTNTNTYVGLNGGFNLGHWRLRHNGSLSVNSSAKQHGSYHYQRGQTVLQRSMPSFKSQLSLGEGFTDGQVFDSVGYRGVRLASDDRMYPQSQRGYAPTVRGIANTNARVQVRQNGIVIYESTVTPGPFVIDDLYPTGYGSDLDVLITEADGTVRTSRLPYAADVKALRPGATRYSVTAGSYRDPLLSSHPWLIEATLRRGLTNLLTGYGGVTAAQGYQAVQGGTALNTHLGAFGLDLTLARTQLPGRPPLQGNSLRLSYSKLLSSDTNITLASYRYSSANYLSLRDAMQLRNPVREPWYQTGNLPDQWQAPPPWVQGRDATPLPSGRMRGQWTININQTLRTGSVFLNGSTQDYWDRRGRSTQFSAGYNTSWRDVTAGVSLARQYDPLRGRWDNQAMLNISMPLGASGHSPMRSISQVQYSQRSGASLTQSLTGSAGVDNNFSYAANVGYGMDRRTATAGANLTYQAPLATLTAGASRGSDYDQVNAGISGGFVIYRGGIAFTPTMGDTLAIVEAKGAAGARVIAGAGLRVDRFGHAVVANLMPFQQNEIEIDPKGLPTSTELRTTTQRTVPSDGAVVPVQFDVQAGGRAALVEAMLADGQLLPFGAQVLDAQGQAVGVVAQAGRVMLRNLTADQDTYTIRWGDQPEQSCALAVNLPSSAPADSGWQRMTGVCRNDGPLVQSRLDFPSDQGVQGPPPQQPAPAEAPAMGASSPSASTSPHHALSDAIGPLPMNARASMRSRARGHGGLRDNAREPPAPQKATAS